MNSVDTDVIIVFLTQLLRIFMQILGGDFKLADNIGE